MIAFLKIILLAGLVFGQTTQDMHCPAYAPMPTSIWSYDGYKPGWYAVQVLADVRVDSNWTTGGYQTGLRSYAGFSILAKDTVDTSVFGNEGPLLDPDGKVNIDSLISYDPSLFPPSLIDSFYPIKTAYPLEGHYTVGETLYDVFLFLEVYGPQKIMLGISESKCHYLKEADPPFGIKRALDFFNTHLEDNGLTKGYLPVMHSGYMKLGPVFNLAWGQRGWGVTAFHDTAYWYIRHLVGWGDCPMCYSYDITTYKISATGTVDSIDQCSRYECENSILDQGYERINPDGSIKGDMVIFDLQGKIIPARALPNAGIYFMVKRHKGKLYLFKRVVTGPWIP